MPDTTDPNQLLRKILCDVLTVNDDKGSHLNLSLVDKLEAKILEKFIEKFISREEVKAAIDGCTVKGGERAVDGLELKNRLGLR